MTAENVLNDNSLEIIADKVLHALNGENMASVLSALPVIAYAIIQKEAIEADNPSLYDTFVQQMQALIVDAQAEAAKMRSD